ncbi:MAG: S-formylglutathione hydrolase [Gammaproteobacteria bacterium]|nr:S-formylglutathione hydrolase [Gammaproteobacteria bacterium]
MEQIESIKEWDGWLNRYTHASSVCNCEMTFSVYLPPQAAQQSVASLYFLSGLTCTDDNVRTKAGAQRYAAEQGIALIMPDTSPRGDGVADEPDRYDLGMGAGFYVNATQAPWSAHYQMYDYVVKELPALVEAELPLVPGLRSVTGHSMGGHGALICALKNPSLYKSVSAFAPISNPTQCGWGHGCFGAYLGDDRTQWSDWDAVELIKSGTELLPMKVDQGTGDEFLEEYLHPQSLADAMSARGADVDMQLRDDYDHSYHFIGTYIGEHIAFHATHLK